MHCFVVGSIAFESVTAAAVQGLIPLWAGVLITALDAFLLLLIERFGVRNLEALFGALIAIMAGSFGVMAKFAGVRALDVAEGGCLRFPQSLHVQGGGRVSCAKCPVAILEQYPALSALLCLVKANIVIACNPVKTAFQVLHSFIDGFYALQTTNLTISLQQRCQHN